MKVAYYSPLPPSRSGIADYSTLLLPALRERVEEVRIAQPGRRHPVADVALYHVGNDPDAHGWIVDALRRTPHPSHWSLPQTLDWIARMKPRRPFCAPCKGLPEEPLWPSPSIDSIVFTGLMPSIESSFQY